MKYRIVFIGFLSLVLIWQACDKIDSPYVKPTGGGIIDPGDIAKVVLIEKFTGHRCPNCPDMAERIKALQNTYDKQIVVVSVHAGFFATPLGDVFSVDYRTAEGTELDQFFGIGQEGYPKGLLSRTAFGTPDFLLGSDQLAGRVAEVLEEDPTLKLEINPSYSAGDRTINIEVDVSILESMQRKLLLSVFITEDSIVSPQKDKTETVHDYVHRHVLRASVNGTWGENLSDGNEIHPGTSFRKTYQSTIFEHWNDEHCAIIAFVYDADTYEVLQAAEVKVR